MATKKNTAKATAKNTPNADVKDEKIDAETTANANTEKASQTSTQATDTGTTSAPKALKRSTTAKAKKTTKKTSVAEQLAKAREQINESNCTGGAKNVDQADSEDVLNEYSQEAQNFIKNGTVVAQDAPASTPESEKQEQEQEVSQAQEQPNEQVEPEQRGKGRPKSNIKKKKILIYLPEELLERLDKIVHEAGQSRVGYIQRAITTAVKLSEKE